MEMFHSMYAVLETVEGALKLTLESISVVCVGLGLITSLVLVFGSLLRTGSITSLESSVRMKFGSWLVLALEFQLGADIVATTVNPNFKTLAELAALAAIRTFLNYFLQKELKSEAELMKKDEGVRGD